MTTLSNMQPISLLMLENDRSTLWHKKTYGLNIATLLEDVSVMQRWLPVPPGCAAAGRRMLSAPSS